MTIARVREPYSERVARLEAQGYSRAQARGHAAEARQPSVAAVRAVGTGRTARISTTPIRQSDGTFKDRTLVAVIDKNNHLRVFEMDPKAKGKLTAQVHEIFPDAPEPEDTP